MGGFNPGQLLEAASSRQRDHLGFLDSNSAFGSLEGIGFDQGNGLGGHQLASMFDAMELTKFRDIGKYRIFGAFISMGIDQALGISGADTAFDLVDFEPHRHC